MSLETELAKMDRLVNALAHEINKAHNIDCNDRAKYHIRNHLTSIRNQNEMKWDELNIWLRANTDATVGEIQVVRTELNSGKSVRGFKVKRLAIL